MDDTAFLGCLSMSSAAVQQACHSWRLTSIVFARNQGEKETVKNTCTWLLQSWPTQSRKRASFYLFYQFGPEGRTICVIETRTCDDGETWRSYLCHITRAGNRQSLVFSLQQSTIHMFADCIQSRNHLYNQLDNAPVVSYVNLITSGSIIHVQYCNRSPVLGIMVITFKLKSNPIQCNKSGILDVQLTCWDKYNGLLPTYVISNDVTTKYMVWDQHMSSKWQHIAVWSVCLVLYFLIEFWIL